jgi:hypothetical protein
MNEWYKGRAGFIITVVLITVIFVSIVLWFSPKLGKRGLVDFTYHLESYSEQHQLTVDADLSDGMNISEAVLVADALFDNCMGSHPHEVVSANMSVQRIWNVELAWDGGHWSEQS